MIFIDDADRKQFRDLLCEHMHDNDVPCHAGARLCSDGQSRPPAADAIGTRAHSHVRCETSDNATCRPSTSAIGGRARCGKSCLAEIERYLMTVHRYIELNQVRASMVEQPKHYP
ncbi:hypothetical protein GCM10027285_20830 [Oleiagrimonas citrea]